MKLEKTNSHPRDSRILFDEEPHIYYIDNKPYDISVTSFIHQFFQAFNDTDVISKNYEKWQLNRHPKYFGLTTDEIQQMWKDNRKTAANLGSILHRDIEFFYNEIPFDNNSLEFKFFLNFHNKIVKRFIPYRTEWRVFDEELKLAGSIDIVFLRDDRSVIICDWKRSKNIIKENPFQSGKNPICHIADCNYWHYSLQLNIYKFILEKNYSAKVSDLFLVVLHPDQEDYMLIKVPCLVKEVEQILNRRKLDLK